MEFQQLQGGRIWIIPEADLNWGVVGLRRENLWRENDGRRKLYFGLLGGEGALKWTKVWQTWVKSENWVKGPTETPR